MPKKILVLVLTFLQEPYRSLMMAQRETWDSVEDDVRTIYYHGGGPEFFNLFMDDRWPWRERYSFNASDDYFQMHWKFKLALDVALATEWDMIFRTNSSSYVNKKQLVSFASNLPNEKVYGGWTLQDTNHDGGDCVSGAGIFLSRDCARILADKMPGGPQCEEDVLIGRILRDHGMKAFDDRSRITYPFEPQRWHTAYHVMFKTDNRQKDVENMKYFHKKIHQ